MANLSDEQKEQLLYVWARLSDIKNSCIDRIDDSKEAINEYNKLKDISLALGDYLAEFGYIPF